ncbi:MAG TPA: MmcQ/YjbR family DNA-binding protein [Acidimicrobiales bacterium]
MPPLRDVLLDYCQTRPAAIEEYPFGEDVAVFKVGGRMFALLPLVGEAAEISLKCEPGLAEELRARHPAIRAGYHLNKQHWNTITLDGSLERDRVIELVDHSYERVVAGLSRAARQRLGIGGASEPGMPVGMED